MASEWVEWHQGYAADPGRSQRLQLVQKFLGEALDRAAAGPVRILSLCAGDGRDVLGVLTRHPRRGDARAILVESDHELASAGREEAARGAPGGGQVTFLEADASTTDALRVGVPADVLLLCGIFGNISDEDVRNTVHHARELLAAGGTVLWTRGRFEPDLTPAIRGWFEEDGFDELAFARVPEGLSTVGVARLRSPPRAWKAGVRLFTFLPKADRPSTRR